MAVEKPAVVIPAASEGNDSFGKETRVLPSAFQSLRLTLRAVAVGLENGSSCPRLRADSRDSNRHVRWYG